MRYDPDGNEKRRAVTGELHCSQCTRFFRPVSVDGRTMGYCGRGTETNVYARALCHPWDFAGECSGFQAVVIRKPWEVTL